MTAGPSVAEERGALVTIGPIDRITNWGPGIPGVGRYAVSSAVDGDVGQTPWITENEAWCGEHTKAGVNDHERALT